MEIKFRAWDWYKMHYNIAINEFWKPISELRDTTNHIIMQYTWLKDKNWKKTCNLELYEYDILDKRWFLIGNKFENNELLEDKTNILIEKLCTKEWMNCYKKITKFWRDYA